MIGHLGLLLLALSASRAGENSIWPTRRSADPDWGGDLYDKHCWQCHGRQGQGAGPAAASLTVAVPPLRGRSDEDTRPGLVATAWNGKGAMPSYQDSITRPDLRRVFLYLESLDDPNRKPAEEDDETPVPEGDAPAGAEGNGPEPEGNGPEPEGGD